MKRHIKATLFLIFLSTIVLNSQNLETKETKEYKDEYKINKIETVYTSDQGITGIVRYDKKYIVFDSFNQELVKINTRSKDKDKKEYYLGDFLIEDKIYALTENFSDVTTKKIKLYTQNLKSSTLNVKEINTSEINKRASLFSNHKGSKIAISPNGEYLGMVSFSVNRNTLYFHFQIFDTNNFSLLYEKQFTKNENKYFELSDIIIDDESNIYAFCESHFQPEDPRKKFSSRFLIEQIGPEIQNSVSIRLDGKFINALKPTLIKDKFHLFSLYSNNDNEETNGICNFIVNKSTLVIENSVYNNIPDRIYKNLFGSNYVESDQRHKLTDFRANELIKDESDNIYFIAEKFYFTTNRNNSGKVPHHDDLMIFKFGNEGTLLWGQGLFKEAIEPSYSAFIKNDYLHVILNSGKDLETTSDGSFIVGRGFLEGTSLYDFIYSTDGILELKKIQDNRKNTLYQPSLGTYVNQKFIMPSDSEKSRRFMILE